MYTIDIYRCEADERKPPTLRKYPTVSRADPRNELAHIIEGALNSCDAAYLGQTFQTLLDPACRLESTKLSQDPSLTSTDSVCSDSNNAVSSTQQSSEKELGSAVKVVIGRENIINQFMGCLLMIPDGIFLVHEWKLFSRPNNSCCLVLKFSFTGSQVFNSSLPCIIVQEALECKQQANSLTIPIEDTVEEVNTKKTEIALTSSALPKLSPGTIARINKIRTRTIRFVQRSRACKYDHRKRQRKLTVGEFVEKHQHEPGNIPYDIAKRIAINSPSDSSLPRTTLTSAYIMVSSESEEEKKVCAVDNEHEDEDDHDSFINSGSPEVVEEEDTGSKEMQSKTASFSLPCNSSDSNSSKDMLKAILTKVQRRNECSSINVRGMMRWTLSADNLVTSIQCHRIVNLID